MCECMGFFFIKLLPGDVGRPVTDLASELRYPELPADTHLVLQSLVPQERTIEATGGRWFSARIMPYRTLDDRIDGLHYYLAFIKFGIGRATSDAAHEIRDRGERIGFFRGLRRVLRPHGRVIVTEHLRDFANIIAYSVGAWHFHPRGEWLATFDAAGFRVAREFRNNPFITTFILEAHEDPA